MEVYCYSHFSDRFNTVLVSLYLNVTNASDIRARIIQAATTQDASEQEAMNFAFLDAALITSRLHLQTAIHQALLADSQAALRTKTVHSEILWMLNPSNNITEAIRRYGISDKTRSVIVVRIGSSTLDPQAVQQQLDALVRGEQSSLSQIQYLTDWDAVKKYHKLDKAVMAEVGQGHPERERAAVDNIVISSVAMKSVLA